MADVCHPYRATDKDRLIDLADHVLEAWRSYTDEAGIHFCRDGRRAAQYNHADRKTARRYV